MKQGYPLFTRTIICLFYMRLIICPISAHGQTLSTNTAVSNLCSLATAQVERSLRLPEGFLSAISRVETGQPDSQGILQPWPWSVNAAGVGYRYASRNAAIAAVRQLQKQGVTSLDIGCMQVNILHHPEAFPSLEIAFDPYSNAHYAGLFLQKMREKTGSWPNAAAAYHSQTPDIGTPYLQRVLKEWATPHSVPAPLLPTPQQSITHSSVKLDHAAKPLFSNQHSLFPHNSSSHGQPKTTSAPIIRPASPYPHHVFHPFKGLFRAAMPPPPHKRMETSQKGRNLASYRATPIHTVSGMPHEEAY